MRDIECAGWIIADGREVGPGRKTIIFLRHSIIITAVVT